MHEKKRSRKPRQQWHLLYYLLAGFNILTVIVSLLLMHRMMLNSTLSVENGSRWQTRIKDFAEMFTLADRIKVPVDDLFESGDVAGERQRMRAALATFNEFLRRKTRSLLLDSESAEDRPVTMEVSLAKQAIEELVQEAEQFFDAYATNSPAASARRQAEIDRKMRTFYGHLSNVNLRISGIQTRILSQELEEGARLRQMEYALAGLILLMLGGSVYYGDRITKRINEDAEELSQTHQRLLDTARQAGMAEIATGVLHNVGNVLNSVNVSATLVADEIRKSKAGSLERVARLIEENRADLGRFLTEDPRGSQIPGFLKTLAGHLLEEQQRKQTEMESLAKNLEHVKVIISMQQSFAKVAGVAETLPVADIIEDALRLNAVSFQRHDIEVIREFEARPTINVERHKVLQILVNLTRNAKEALDKAAPPRKRLTLRLSLNGTDGVRISVKDNGMGISPENLTRIFQHGFTTRKEGHGFGLHSGALAAREMGGQLSVSSEGAGQGATFTLDLPLKPPGDNAA